MNPQIMASIHHGPNQGYANEYASVNTRINEQAEKLAAEISFRGYGAKPLAASDRTDTVNIKGDFPHKTAATRAGLGWIGRHCQLITRDFGPWVRLGTVFTDMPLPCGQSVERSFCGRCKLCVEACPAKALKGKSWYPGLPREDILDVQACDRWKKEHYFSISQGAQLRNLLGGMSIWFEKIKKEAMNAKLQYHHPSWNNFGKCVGFGVGTIV